MAYSPPNFNLNFNGWNWPDNPQSGDPVDYTFQGQLYRWSRSTPDSFDDDLTFFEPYIWVRAPLSTLFGNMAIGDIVQTNPPRFTSWRVRFMDVQHPGFPNAYDVALMSQCNPDGSGLFQFPTIANIWHGFVTGTVVNPFVPPSGPADVRNVKCRLDLRQGGAYAVLTEAFSSFSYGHSVGQLTVAVFPARTDVRTQYPYPAPNPPTYPQLDLVELPAGSKRWYAVDSVDDRMKITPFEVREATLYWVGYTGSYPMA